MTLVYLSSTTVSGSTSTGFTLPSGYDIFEFHYKDVYTNRQTCCTTGIDSLTFGLSVSGTYSNQPRTSTYIRAWNFNTDTTSATLGYYSADADTDYGGQQITHQLGGTTNNYYRGNGVVTLYDPFSTSFMKHFTTRSQSRYYYGGTSSTNSVHTSCYYQSASPVVSVYFGINSPWANYLYGDFHMYGVK